jgi:hypothetical protein
MRMTLAALLLALPHWAAATATVLYEDNAVAVAKTLADATDLWVSPTDLTRINGFVLKPEGACIDDICVPVKQDEDSDIFVTRNNQSWFNVTELAKRLQQAYAVDHGAGVWSFGAVPARRSDFLKQGLAPAFALPNRQGEEVTLADYDGMKVLLLTWASW